MATPTFKIRKMPNADHYAAYVDWQGLDNGKMPTRFGFYRTREMAAEEAQKQIDRFLAPAAAEVAPEEVDDLVGEWEPCPDDPDASKADAEICKRIAAKRIAATCADGTIKANMKIRPEHYVHMKAAIQPLLSQIAERRDAIIAEGKFKDLEKRLRWDLLYAAGLLKWLCDNVYSYANDDHIDTALRNIVR